MLQINKTQRFLFETSESDNEKVYRGNDGKFYSKRYGLPVMEISEKWARHQAWMQANRTGKFSHLIYYKVNESIPYLSNTEAQTFIVNLMLQLN